jgi:23S rRNA (cytidine1920-2'-O)/16S rRNA (cytidine1409-2'-O)-methyltransferase
MILAGNVLVEDTPETKSGTLVLSDAEIRLKVPDHPYVSRAALKLKGALTEFGLDPKNAVALDVGASTGGFTQVLLEAGALKVFAVDVGTNQLDWKLRADPRVVSIEKTHIRELSIEQVPETADWFVIDVSFIGLAKVLPHILKFLKPRATGVVLLKPQFEAGPEGIEKGGIVTDPAVHLRVMGEFERTLSELGFELKAKAPAAIAGTDGNQEYVYWLVGP